MTQLVSSYNRTDIERIVRDALSRRFQTTAASGKPNPLVVNISARHVHLTDEHVQILFGKPELESVKDLYQDGYYAAKE